MPHYLTQEINGTGLLSVWKLTETEEKLLIMRKLSKEELSQLSKLKSQKRRIEFLASRILLQQLLNQNIEIEYLSNGKPILISPNYYFSLSHSKDFIAIIISQNKEVGIDIEKMRNNMETLKEKFLSKKELKTISTSDNFLLHLYWGAKEAMYKMYSSYQPLFTEHLFLENINLKTQKATGIVKQENFYKKIDIQYQQVEDNLLIYCWEN
jgi:4'-phosphopantetheinyl transferase EntD